MINSHWYDQTVFGIRISQNEQRSVINSVMATIGVKNAMI